MNRFIQLVASFDKNDWKEYRKFAKSKYSEETDLYQIQEYFYTNKEKNFYVIDQEEVRVKIKPNTSSRVFSNTLGKLADVVEEFLIKKEMDSRPALANAMLLSALAKRGLVDLFDKKRKAYIKDKYIETINLWKGLDQLFLHHAAYFQYVQPSSLYNKKDLEEAAKGLIDFASAIGGYYQVEMINRHNVLNENWDEEIELLDKFNIDASPLTKMYQSIIALKVEKQEENYDYLYSLLDKEEKLSPELKYLVLIHLVSFLNHKIKTGYLDAAEKILGLYEYGLRENILTFAGKIPVRRFLNIINIACGLEKWKWAEDFLHEWIKKVDRKYQDDIIKLTKVQIAFSQKKYDNVLSFTLRNSFKLLDLELKARWMTLCAMYVVHKEHPKLVNSNIRSFTYYINKHKKEIDNATYKGMKNLAKYIKKMLQKPPVPKLESQIREEHYLVSRKWLLDVCK